jgi:hypothetical protein
MEPKECVICLSEIVINDYYTLTCCRNDVHIYCLNDWIKKNIAKKNISKCFICSQENSIIETMVSYNSTTNNTYDNNSINNDNNSINNDNNSINNDNNSINNDNNSINNEIILYNDNHTLTISYNIDKRLYYLFISIKLCFFISVSCLLIFVLYFII